MRDDDPAPLPLETATADTFEPHVGSTFATDGNALTLVGVRRHGHNAGYPREWPFTLDLVGPPPALESRIHRFEHDALGIVEVFVVPVGQDADGVRYEVLFA